MRVAAADNDLLILNVEANEVMRLTWANASAGDIIDTLGTHGLLGTGNGRASLAAPTGVTATVGSRAVMSSPQV